VTDQPFPLSEYIRRFNLGPERGDWAPMLAHFAPDARLAFEGIPVGPLVGRDEIAEAYRVQPPDDTITVVDVREPSPTEIVAGYAWDRQPQVRAGELIIQHDGSQIRSLLVTFAASEVPAQ
jgi:hypothetical protein